jgi:hypothetical protein
MLTVSGTICRVSEITTLSNCRVVLELRIFLSAPSFAHMCRFLEPHYRESKMLLTYTSFVSPVNRGLRLLCNALLFGGPLAVARPNLPRLSSSTWENRT